MSCVSREVISAIEAAGVNWVRRPDPPAPLFERRSGSLNGGLVVLTFTTDVEPTETPRLPQRFQRTSDGSDFAAQRRVQRAHRVGGPTLLLPSLQNDKENQ